MKRLYQGLIAGLAMGLVVGACSDRPVGEEEPPPDIEGLCHEYCALVMECVWYPGASADFTTEEGCRRNCEADVMWEKCTRVNEAMYTCFTQTDCPEFAEFGTDPDGPCHREARALSGCTPSRVGR
jgi:hypothetical protein